jgi:hypothetical protein
MTNAEKIALLEQQLKSVREAYAILEEYVCELVDDPQTNETITYCNSIIELNS